MVETSRRHECKTNAATIDQGTHSKTIELQCWRWGCPAFVTQKGPPTTTFTCRNSNRKSIFRSWWFPSRTLCLNTACKPTYCQHSTTSSNKSAFYRGTQRRFPPKYIENTFLAIQSTFRHLEMHSKRRYKISICSVVLGKRESFRNYQGFRIFFP